MSNQFRVINQLTGDVLCNSVTQEACAAYITNNGMTVLDRRFLHNLTVVYVIKVVPPGMPQPPAEQDSMF